MNSRFLSGFFSAFFSVFFSVALLSLSFFTDTAYAQCTPTLGAIPMATNQGMMRFIKRDMVLYFAEGFKSGIKISDIPDTQESLDLGCLEHLRPTLQEAIKSSALSPSSLDLWELRKFLAADFLANRDQRHLDFAIPTTLGELEKMTSFKKWEGQLVVNSRVKGLTRKLYHSPSTFPVKISLAQTHLTQDENLSTPVRETEVLIERSQGSGQWDFYAYDADGNISLQSDFKGGPRPAPLICLSCHYEPATRKMSPMLRPGL